MRGRVSRRVSERRMSLGAECLCYIGAAKWLKSISPAARHGAPLGQCVRYVGLRNLAWLFLVEP